MVTVVSQCVCVRAHMYVVHTHSCFSAFTSPRHAGVVNPILRQLTSPHSQPPEKAGRGLCCLLSCVIGELGKTGSFLSQARAVLKGMHP